MSTALHTTLVAILLLSASVWLGGYVAIAVVMLAARNSLETPARVKFFRALGRAYLPVGGGALILMIVSGAALLRGHPLDGVTVALIITVTAIAIVLAVAVRQARRMTRLRHALVESPDDAALAATVRQVGQAAVMLRALLGVLSVGGVVLAAVVATG